jgi:hypothetical protein
MRTCEFRHSIINQRDDLWKTLAVGEKHPSFPIVGISSLYFSHIGAESCREKNKDSLIPPQNSNSSYSKSQRVSRKSQFCTKTQPKSSTPSLQPPKNICNHIRHGSDFIFDSIKLELEIFGRGKRRMPVLMTEISPRSLQK